MSKKSNPKLARQICERPGCGKTVHVATTGRKPRFCCDLCRALEHRRRQQRAKFEREAVHAKAAAENPGGEVWLVNGPRRPGRGQGAVVSDSHGAAHQRGPGTSTVRYSTHAVLHIAEEHVEETSPLAGGEQ